MDNLKLILFNYTKSDLALLFFLSYIPSINKIIMKMAAIKTRNLWSKSKKTNTITNKDKIIFNTNPTLFKAVILFY
ncbi:hypothetical protein ACQKM9_21200, partial [Viridibacillus sp. NPDC093762]|uniref:hypothetical protein n=1 Tax=Viridibacillus sp. NPDC093762 TaxID=3390720 RepID=UPI003D04ECFF